MSGTALEILQQNQAALPTEVQERWGIEQLAAEWNTIAPGASFGEYAMVLSLAARYDLDPLAREIWFAKDRSGRPLIMVGRDGLLKVARRQPDFLNIDYDVHRKNDHFRVVRSPEGTRTVEHVYEGGPEERGEILGAWAMIERTGGKWTNYTYTPIEEYAPKADSGYSPWHKQRSAMITKCAQSLAIRIGYGLAGVVGYEEVSAQFDATQPLSAGDGSGQAAGVDLPPEVEAIIGRAKQLGHVQYSNRAAVELALGGRSDSVKAEWIERATSVLDGLEGQDAEVVSESEIPIDTDGLPDRPEVKIDEPALRRQLEELEDWRAGLDPQMDADRLDQVEAEIEFIREQLADTAIDESAQERLDV